MENSGSKQNSWVYLRKNHLNRKRGYVITVAKNKCDRTGFIKTKLVRPKKVANPV